MNNPKRAVSASETVIKYETIKDIGIKSRNILVAMRFLYRINSL
jgi:hypothetical protein